MAANRLQMNPTKTELLWAGSKHNITMLISHAPATQFSSDTVGWLLFANNFMCSEVFTKVPKRISN